MPKTLGQWFAQERKGALTSALRQLQALAQEEVLSVQRTYGDIRAIGLANTDGDTVFPEAGSLVVVIPKED